MIVAIFPHPTHPDATKLAKQIVDFFHAHKVKVVAEPPYTDALSVDPLSSVKEVEFLISMGGDGTILRLAHKYRHLKAAILGINLGHLGFMADVPTSDLLPSLRDFLEGAYTIENRLMIEGKAPNGQTFYAINDFVMHRAHNPSLIELSIYLDDLYLNTFEADGIILATPNGSTAYSLAAGGPILSPGLDGFVITPICPHTISNRPIVLTTTQELRIEYQSHYPKIEVIADGLDTIHITPRQSFSFKKSNKTFRLVTLKRRDYYSTLRTKLGWSGKLRH